MYPVAARMFGANSNYVMPEYFHINLPEGVDESLPCVYCIVCLIVSTVYDMIL